MLNIISNWEMYIKLILGYPLTPTRMAKIRKTNNINVGKDAFKIRTLIHCWWNHTMVHPFWKTILQLLKILNIELQWSNVVYLNIEFRSAMTQQFHF